jgi:flagellar hook-basal body complex protein FliE
MAFRANQQLREDMWDYRYKSSPVESPVESEKIVSFPPSTSRDFGTTALNIVQQAADIFGDMENQARETEARAQSMYKNLTEKLQQAEMQRDSSERARREIVNELNNKLRDVTRALQQAEVRITEAEERTVAAEFRAQAAENQLYKANRELAAVEDAIRKRLL